MKQFRSIIGTFLREDLLDREEGTRSFLLAFGEYGEKRSFHARATFYWRWEMWDNDQCRITGVDFSSKGLKRHHSINWKTEG